jgi:hypothetical protein
VSIQLYFSSAELIVATQRRVLQVGNKSNLFSRDSQGRCRGQTACTILGGGQGRRPAAAQDTVIESRLKKRTHSFPAASTWSRIRTTNGSTLNHTLERRTPSLWLAQP